MADAIDADLVGWVRAVKVTQGKTADTSTCMRCSSGNSLIDQSDADVVGQRMWQCWTRALQRSGFDSLTESGGLDVCMATLEPSVGSGRHEYSTKLAHEITGGQGKLASGSGRTPFRRFRPRPGRRRHAGTSGSRPLAAADSWSGHAAGVISGSGLISWLSRRTMRLPTRNSAGTSCCCSCRAAGASCGRRPTGCAVSSRRRCLVGSPRRLRCSTPGPGLITGQSCAAVAGVHRAVPGWTRSARPVCTLAVEVWNRHRLHAAPLF